MNKLPIFHKVSISLVAIIAATIFVYLYTSPSISTDSVRAKSGKVEAAECYESRSSVGVKLLVDYTGIPEQDFILLPINTDCKKIIGKFKGNEITITYHENVYLGVSVAGETVVHTSQALSEFNNKTSSLLFISFLASAFIFVIYFRGKHVTSQASGTPQSGAPS